MAQAPECFTMRGAVLPDPRLVGPRLSGGQAGRDLAEAVWRGDAADATARLRADPRLAGVHVVADPALDSQPDGRYGDLLVFAVARCDRSMLTALLDAGVPVDGVERGSALSLALRADDPVLAETLLARGASPDPQKAGGQDVWNDVSAMQHIAGAMMLIRHGVDVRWADARGRTHLRDTLSMQSYAIAELLVKAGADLWQADADGVAPAHTLAKAPAAALLTDTDAAARERLVTLAKAGGRPWPPAPLPRG